MINCDLIEYDCISCIHYWDNEKCAVCYRYDKWQPCKTEHNCSNCANANVDMDEEPCYTCDDGDSWEEQGCYNCKYRDHGLFKECAACNNLSVWESKWTSRQEIIQYDLILDALEAINSERCGRYIYGN